MLSWRMNVNMLSKRIDLDGLEISGLKHRRSTLPAIPWPLDRPRHHYCEWNGDIAAEKYGTTGAGDAPKAEKVRSDVEPQQFNIRSSQPATGQDQIALPMARRVALSR
jgi:hypothetical protein